MTVEEMLVRMSAWEFQHWLELWKRRPFGEMGDYLRAGRIAATIANVNRDAKTTQPFKPKDVMPELNPLKPEGKRRQTFEDQRAILRGAAR